MALLNWGNALAEAGKSMATMGLEGVKSVLEQDKIRLADQLATEREATSDYRKQGFARENLQTAETIRREGKQADINIETNPANVQARVTAANNFSSGTLEQRLREEGDKKAQELRLTTADAVTRAAELQKVSDERVKRIADDPAMLKAFTKVAEANEAPSARAAHLAAAALSNVQADAAKALNAARKNLSVAQASGDAATIKAAKATLDGLTYDSSAERAELTAAASVLKTSESLIANLNTSLAQALDDSTKAAIQKRITSEQETYEALRNQIAKKLGLEAKPAATPGAAAAPGAAASGRATTAASTSVTVGGITYERPANFTDAQWDKYKKDQGVK